MKKIIVITILISAITTPLHSSDNPSNELNIIKLNDNNDSSPTSDPLSIQENTIEMNYQTQHNPKRCSLHNMLKSPVCYDPRTSWKEIIEIGSGITMGGTVFITACTWCEGYFCFDASCSTSCKLAWIGVNDCSSRSSCCFSVIMDIKTALLGISSLVFAASVFSDSCVGNNVNNYRENKRTLNQIENEENETK